MSIPLANEHLSIVLDDRGGLASLVNRRTGCEYVNRPGLDFWRMIYRHEGDPETPIRSSDQQAPRVSGGADWVEFRYEEVVDCAGRRVDASLAWRAELHGEEVTFTAELTNRASPMITELWFPMAGGLGSMGGDAAGQFLLYPESGGRRLQHPLRSVADRSAQPVRGQRLNYIRDFYPGRCSMQWMGLYGARGSLYIGSHDATLQTTATNVMLNAGPSPDDDSLSLGFIKYPFLQAGKRWRSEPFVIAVHNGPWHRDARRYRAFADTWQHHARPKAQWVQDMPAMHDVILLHQHGRVNFSYARIGEIAQAAARAGINVIKLTGWSRGGHDNMYPDFVPSDRLGGEQALVENIRKVQAAGAHVVLYFHFIQMTPNSEFYREHGELCAMKGPGGNPFVDVFTWPSNGTVLAMNERMPLINACVGARPWQQQVMACVERGLGLGADCVFLDQTAGGPGSYLCFDERHGHPSPAFAAGPNKVELSRRAHERVKSERSEAALGAEYITDAILQFYDFSIPFGSGFFYGHQNFGRMYRYTFPEDILTTQYMAREDFSQLHFSFVLGYRFFVAPRQQCELLTSLDPAFVRRLASLIRLRRKYGAILMRGRYLDIEPLHIGATQLVAAAYQAGERRAVVVWNPTGHPQPLDIEWIGCRRQGIETPAGPTDAAELPPDEVAVITMGD